MNTLNNMTWLIPTTITLLLTAIGAAVMFFARSVGSDVRELKQLISSSNEAMQKRIETFDAGVQKQLAEIRQDQKEQRQDISNLKVSSAEMKVVIQEKLSSILRGEGSQRQQG